METATFRLQRRSFIYVVGAIIAVMAFLTTTLVLVIVGPTFTKPTAPNPLLAVSISHQNTTVDGNYVNITWKVTETSRKDWALKWAQIDYWIMINGTLNWALFTKQSEGYWVEIERGSYVVGGEIIKVTIEKDKCPSGSNVAFVLFFVVTGDILGGNQVGVKY